MIGQNYDYLKKRYREFWAKENHDRPLISVFAPKNGAKPYAGTLPDTLRDRWLNFDFVVKRELHTMENTYYGGEAFPALNPNFGPDFFSAVLCDLDIEFGSETSWAIHKNSAWGDFPVLRFDRNNRWWRLLEQVTDYAVQECKDRYLIGLTDIHSGMDALSGIKGAEALCIDLYDDPIMVQKKLQECRIAYRQLMAECFEKIGSVQEGFTNWSQLWEPDRRWYITSCDFSCLVSSVDFDEFILPTLEDEWGFLDSNFYHLDGIGALRHLDRLCSCNKLQGIQWVYGAGQPTAYAWRDILTKIQNSGKCIQVQIVPEDIAAVSEFLAPEGVHLFCYAQSEYDAREIVKMLDNAYRKK